METHQFSQFLLVPVVLVDGAVQVVVVPLTALLPVPPRHPELRIHRLCYLRPLPHLPLLVQALQHSVFLTQSKSTSSVHAFRSIDYNK